MVDGIAGENRTGLRDWYGSLRRRASLGPAIAETRLHGEAHRAAVRQALREKQQERRQRCGGDLRGDEPAEYAFRCGQIGGAAGPPGDTPDQSGAGEPALRQGQPDPWDVQ
jgi:hypothetical protein